MHSTVVFVAMESASLQPAPAIISLYMWLLFFIRLPRRPVSVLVNGVETPHTWDETAHTCFLRFPNNPDGVRVEINW